MTTSTRIRTTIVSLAALPALLAVLPGSATASVPGVPGTSGTSGSGDGFAPAATVETLNDDWPWENPAS